MEASWCGSARRIAAGAGDVVICWLDETKIPRRRDGGSGRGWLGVGEVWRRAPVSDLADVGGLESLGPFDDLELHAVPFGQ